MGLGAGHCAQAFCPFETYGRQEPVRAWEMATELKLCPFETYVCREPVPVLERATALKAISDLFP